MLSFCFLFIYLYIFFYFTIWSLLSSRPEVHRVGSRVRKVQVTADALVSIVDE